MAVPRAQHSPVVVQDGQRFQVAGAGQQRQRRGQPLVRLVQPALQLQDGGALELHPGQVGAGQHLRGPVQLGVRGRHPAGVGQR